MDLSRECSRFVLTWAVCCQHTVLADCYWSPNPDSDTAMASLLFLTHALFSSSLLREVDGHGVNPALAHNCNPTMEVPVRNHQTSAGQLFMISQTFPKHFPFPVYA